MGWLHLEAAIEPVTGEFVKVGDYETFNCHHCGSVIAVLKKGCSTTFQSTHKCDRCHDPICKECAVISKQQGGSCSPLMAKIEHALKHGYWDARLQYRYKILPN